MKVWIKNISYYVPERVVTNQEIIDAHSLRMKASWIEKRIGITERRWCDENTAASDLAVEAVKKMNIDEINGAIYVSTISQDFLTPSTASVVKGKLGWKSYYPAIDMNAACAGQIFALDSAVSRLKGSEDKEALVIATETRSKFLNMKDRRTVFLFADGAVVFHLEKSDEAPGEVEWVQSQTIASEDFEILIPGGGSKLPFNDGVDPVETKIKMQDGEKIFETTTETMIGLIHDQLKKYETKVSDYDFFVFHQGNGAIIRKICGALDIPMEKTHINFDKFGNTSSASMGIALADAHEQGKIKKGGKVLVLAMGAGYHVGIASIKWGL